MKTPQKRALLIGIDSYPNLSTFAQLDGCVNDVRLMASILKDTFGFPEDHITMLTDAAATRDGIVQAMDTLAAALGENDIVVVHYAGHGSQVTDRHGDEPSGLDETIVPHDAARQPKHNRDITDDEIYDWILRVNQQTPYLTLIFDCCHSGTIARDAFGAKARWIEPDGRAAEALPPVAVAGIATRRGETPLGPSGWLPLGQRYVLIAGCRDDEVSREYDHPETGAKHGALTFFLSRELLKAGPDTTYRDVFEQAAVGVTAVFPKQHPQLEGAQDRVLFGVRDAEPMRFIGVTHRDAETVRLAAGAAHGLTLGSAWAVYPAGTKHVDAATARLGRVRIATVRAVSADAQIVEEAAAGSIVAGTRAVEAAHDYGALQLRVVVQTPAGMEGEDAAVRATLEESGLLTTVAAGERADACLYLLPAREEVADADPVPQLGRLAEPVWATVGADGRLLLPLQKAHLLDVRARLRTNLEKVARYRQGLTLTNPDPASVLRGTVTIALGRLDPRTFAWIDAVADEAGGAVVYREGDYVAFRVTNHHTEPVYVNVLDFAPGWYVGLLHPLGAANTPLAAGATLEVGVRPGNRFRMGLPDNFPYEPDPSGVVQGTETFKVFATSHPANFTPLVQAEARHTGVEAMQGGATPLGRLLTLAMTGHGTRAAIPVKAEPIEAWTTALCAFTLRRE